MPSPRARPRSANEALNARLSFERVDVTLPARPEPQGTIHPVSQVLDEITAIFADLGFAIADGPDVEYDDYNFTKLNIPPDHPARQMHDTFYLARQDDGSRHVLRTHTSPVQVRTMLTQKPPIRVIAPGRTYRCDSDATHTPMFHQLEALVIDEDTNLGHLKWVVEQFCSAFFEVEKVSLRARPSFFPFTEPSVEWDINCDRSGGTIKFGAGNDWLELGGSGMVHPQRARNVRHRSRALSGLRVRLRPRSHGDAEIRRAGFAAVLRIRSALAEAFRLRGARPSDAGRRAQPMKFTLSWLKDHLETDADAKTVAETMTRIGLEVEAVEDKGAGLKDFIVAHVVSAEKHPNADKLKLCMVDTGDDIVQVVCGAPNAHTGMKAVFARPGIVIPVSGEALEDLDHPRRRIARHAVFAARASAVGRA